MSQRLTTSVSRPSRAAIPAGYGLVTAAAKARENPVTACGLAATVGSMDPSAVCAALADPERLRVFGTICQDPDGIPVTARQAPASRKALGRLLTCGLVQRAGDRYVVRPGAFLQALRDAEARQPGSRGAGVQGATGRVAALFSRGRLISIPRPGGLRTELLSWLADRFEPGRIYSEPDIRRELEPLYADHVSLRRYLVDYGLLERDNYGSYWRGAQPPA